jgi:hypothetical protein
LLPDRHDDLPSRGPLAHFKGRKSMHVESNIEMVK